MKSLLLALAMLVSSGLVASAQEKKDPEKKDSAKTKQLPQNWAKLGLSDEQKARVHSIQAEFKAKIDVLAKQLAEVRKKEREALDEVLTDTQRTRLKEIVLEKTPGTTRPVKPEDKPAAKVDDTKPTENSPKKPETRTDKEAKPDK